jgi:hypothetical protein
MGYPLPYPPFHRGFFGSEGGIIPSKKSWKNFLEKRPFVLKCSLYIKNKFWEIFWKIGFFILLLIYGRREIISYCGCNIKGQ